MPGFDGTGPVGQGQMTGGGRGYCVVSLNGADARLGNGRGSYGRGGGRGFRNCFYATGRPGWMRAQKGAKVLGGLKSAMLKSDEVSVLKEEASYLKEQLDAIQSRIQDLGDK